MQAVCLQCPEDDKRFAHMRGLCPRCYGRCLTAVRRKDTSWADLERAGLAYPPGPQGQAWGKRIGAGKQKRED
jgi:hypothetical protein